MNSRTFPVSDMSGYQPLTCTRRLAECRVANRPLLDVQRDAMVAALESAGADSTLCLTVREDAWVSAAGFAGLIRYGEPAVLREASGEPLAWCGPEAQVGLPPDEWRELEADAGSFRIRYSWDLLRVNEILLDAVDRQQVRCTIGPQVNIDGSLIAGEGTILLPGVYIEGTVVIGRNCKIGPNCYIRGRTSIADGCHVGQAVEIKNSILMPNVSIGHLSYCGDSIVGTDVNFGAGTVTANFRHDGCNHRSMIEGQLVDTGRRKFGAIIGDGVHTGIHTSIYPGRKLWPGCSTRPGTVVQRDIQGSS